MLADIVFTNEGAIAIAGLLATLAGAGGVVFKLLIKNYDQQMADLKSQRDSYRQMNDESVRALESVVNAKRAASGKLPFAPLAAVVPEHSSPVTEKQQTVADIATVRAKLTAAKMELGLPPRDETEEERTKRIADELAAE